MSATPESVFSKDQAKTITKKSQLLPTQDIARSTAVINLRFEQPLFHTSATYLTVEHYRSYGITDITGCKITSVAQRYGVVSTSVKVQPWGERSIVKGEEAQKQVNAEAESNNYFFILNDEDAIELISGLTMQSGTCQTPKQMFDSYLEIIRAQKNVTENETNPSTCPLM